MSNLYSTFPDFISWIAFVTSIVTVPDLGFGINPFGLLKDQKLMKLQKQEQIL